MDGVSIAMATWPDADQDKLDVAVSDFLACLSQLNHELNGETPSQTQEGVNSVPISLVYAVTEALRFLRQLMLQSGEPEVARLSWLSDTAGLRCSQETFDDLQEHLRHEEAMRG